MKFRSKNLNLTLISNTLQEFILVDWPLRQEYAEVRLNNIIELYMQLLAKSYPNFCHQLAYIHVKVNVKYPDMMLRHSTYYVREPKTLISSILISWIKKRINRLVHFYSLHSINNFCSIQVFNNANQIGTIMFYHIPFLWW